VPASSSARQVAASTTPVAGTPCAFCQLVTAACVSGPNAPSAVAPTACWTALTTGPLSPRCSCMPE
jgi:hypothetical protein